MIWNPAAECQPPDQRTALQLERLQLTLQWASARVPFYAERLKGHAVRSLDELAGLPFTRKSDLREHYPLGLFAVPPGELARIHASSGTRGKPTVVGYTQDDLEMWREVMARVMVAAGARPRDLLHIAFGYGL
ncbi:MAG TPA: phenylacetate--CoA ligase, partial [Methylomirabilota bacterium]|nr:phenylacetate--CoA ligase [Methylomirabilota bacterium]